MTETDIVDLIEKDDWMMDLLKTVKKLNLPDWWIGAGFVRSKVWDTLHDYDTRTPVPDIDVIYFNKEDVSAEDVQKETTTSELRYESLLKKSKPDINWSVTNQARMHVSHGHAPYKSSTEGLSHWIETATCVGVSLEERDRVVLSAPLGIDDLVNLVLRANPDAYEWSNTLFEERISKKGWCNKWPKLRLLN